MTATEPDIDQATAEDFKVWWESCSTIRSHDGLAMIPQPDMNELQCLIDDAVTWCEANEEPCRIIILKPRKEGATTLLVGKSYHLLRSSEGHLLQIGDKFSTTTTMWDMLATYERTDAFAENWSNRTTRFTSSAQQGGAKWSHGSSAWTDTAGEKRAGQSKTPTIIHAEEVAHWGKDGAAANAADTMLALLNAIVEAQGTYVFVSSTANGIGNWYHRTWQGGVTLEQRKAGIRGNGWIKIFFPWHKSEWTKTKVSPDEAEEIRSTLTKSEEQGMTRHGWDMERIAWRRRQIATKCDGSESKFAQEQPSDDISCFLTSGNPRFDSDGLSRLRNLAKTLQATPKPLRLNRQEDKSVVHELVAGNEAWVHCWEMPKPGCRYLVSVDVSTVAEQQKGSDDPDAHSVCVIRDAYADTNGTVYNVAVVARITAPFCNINLDVLADFVDRISRFYGRCISFVEIQGPGLALIELLKPWGTPVHKRQKWDSLTSRVEQKPGWSTDKISKPLIIATLAQLIRENNLNIYDQQTVDQLQSFITHPSGQEAAIQGCFDDDVMSLGIGLHNRKHGTTFREQSVNVRKIEEQRGYRRDYFGQQEPRLYRAECS